MTDFATLLQLDQGQPARPVSIVKASDFDDWFSAQPEKRRAVVTANGFKAKAGETVVLPGEAPEDWSVVVGAATHPGVWDLAGAASRLPASTYRLSEGAPGLTALGWLLAHDRFDRYLTKADAMTSRILLSPEAAAIPEIVRQAEATALVRAMVNTPASDMGPEELEAAVHALAKRYDAKFSVIKGHALETGYPMIHAVGKAADKHRAPRLIELEWGNPANPRIALVGKGVVFDSGGLDIKPANGMRLMKKDMGGAAHVIGLAQMIMDARLPVRLHLLIPAVENAIAGNAMRPGDILHSRKGTTVEVDNTDAEGRLILADAITKAAEDQPELLIDFATLTGAARVALGPDLPAMFTNDHEVASSLNAASVDVHDAVWRLPLWTRYDEMLKSEIADTMNSSESGFAGAITAALFLKKFVPEACKWVHLDTFAWRPASQPGRPKGGEALGMRAIWEYLKRAYPFPV